MAPISTVVSAIARPIRSRRSIAPLRAIGDDEQPAVADGADRERHPAAPDVAAPARIGGRGPVGGGRDVGEDRRGPAAPGR